MQLLFLIRHGYCVVYYVLFGGRIFERLLATKFFVDRQFVSHIVERYTEFIRLMQVKKLTWNVWKLIANIKLQPCNVRNLDAELWSVLQRLCSLHAVPMVFNNV